MKLAATGVRFSTMTGYSICLQADDEIVMLMVDDSLKALSDRDKSAIAHAVASAINRDA